MSPRVIKETPTEIIYQATYEISVPKPPVSGADLPSEDGIPLDSNWQRAQIDLLIELLSLHWAERQDFYVGGNMFIYYSPQRLKSEDVRGPDFFVVTGVDRTKIRRSWVVWEEDGKYPDVIIELVSPSTRANDEGSKKRLYERTFRTPEYFLYYPDEQKLLGWHLVEGQYELMTADEAGRLWSHQLQLWLGTWVGYSHNGEYNTWLRFYTEDGQLVPSSRELATIEAQARAEAEAQAAAEAQARTEAEARIADLEAEIARLKGKPAAD